MITTTIIAMLNEGRKGMLLAWAHKFNALIQLVVLVATFIGIIFFKALEPAKLASTLLGCMVWYYATRAISSMSHDLQQEAHTGTLEQMYMSPASVEFILLGRVLASFFVTTLKILVIYGILALWLDIHVPVRLAGIVPFALTMIGLFGFGYIIGGATLLFKHIGALSSLTKTLLLFLNGSVLSNESMPKWLFVISKTLPTTEGISVLRKVTLHDQSLALAWADGSLIHLILNSAAYFLVGIVVFKWCERKVKEKGTLGQY